MGISLDESGPAGKGYKVIAEGEPLGRGTDSPKQPSRTHIGSPPCTWLATKEARLVLSGWKGSTPYVHVVLRVYSGCGMHMRPLIITVTNGS